MSRLRLLVHTPVVGLGLRLLRLQFGHTLYALHHTRYVTVATVSYTCRSLLPALLFGSPTPACYTRSAFARLPVYTFTGYLVTRTRLLRSVYARTLVTYACLDSRGWLPGYGCHRTTRYPVYVYLPVGWIRLQLLPPRLRLLVTLPTARTGCIPPRLRLILLHWLHCYLPVWLPRSCSWSPHTRFTCSCHRTRVTLRLRSSVQFCLWFAVTAVWFAFTGYTPVGYWYALHTPVTAHTFTCGWFWFCVIPAVLYHRFDSSHLPHHTVTAVHRVHRYLRLRGSFILFHGYRVTGSATFPVLVWLHTVYLVVYGWFVWITTARTALFCLPVVGLPFCHLPTGCLYTLPCYCLHRGYTVGYVVGCYVRGSHRLPLPFTFAVTYVAAPLRRACLRFLYAVPQLVLIPTVVRTWFYRSPRF